MTTVYFISGLGADERAFSYINLPNVYPIYLHWIEPLNNETIESYAKRLATKITHENPIIIGLSFGGMMAVEISKIISLKQIILISSCKTYKELPWYFRLCKYIPFHKLLPLTAIAYNKKAMQLMFGTRTPEQTKILKSIILNSVKGFNKWAINALVNWGNTTIPKNCIHLQGTADKLLPISFTKPTHIVNGGSHFMVATKAKEISEIIKKHID